MQVVFDMNEQAKCIHACKRVSKAAETLKVDSQRKFKTFHETDQLKLVSHCQVLDKSFNVEQRLKG